MGVIRVHLIIINPYSIMRQKFQLFRNAQFDSRGLFLLIFFALFGCSSTINAPIVTQNVRVPRSEAILVFGVEIEEQTNNLEWRRNQPETEDNQRINTITTQTLLNKRDSLIQAGKFTEDTESITPLHYIKNVILTFQSDGGQAAKIIRYGKSPMGYTPIAIHQMKEGTYRFSSVQYQYQKWEIKPPTPGAKHYEYIDEKNKDFLNVGIEAGDILYLGHFTFYFKTKRAMFGWITPREVILDTKLVGVELTSRFEDTKQYLEKNAPWFPSSELKDHSSTGSWEFRDLVLMDETDRRPKQSADEQKPPESQEKESDKYFF